MPTEARDKALAVGVDGCKAGWFAVEIAAGKDWTINVFSDVKSLWQKIYQSSPVILIDVPIGLPGKNPRSCDLLARKVLRRRSSSVFPVPCRRATRAMSYKDASRINFKETGKKLSVQSWNISSRINEVDAFLSVTPEARGLIRESHPEVCFWALAGGRPMQFNKKAADGYLERKHLLQNLLPLSGKIIKSAKDRYRRKDLAPDDILDALALALTALSPPESIVTFPPNPPLDDQQLAMEIVYTNRLLRMSDFY